MSSGWLSLCGALALICATRATYTHHSAIRCECNGKSRYCLPDGAGLLHCVDCQGNTEGRHCERCRDGFYHQGAGQSCSPCGCSAAGSVSATCDNSGRCSCKDGVTGKKCDRCPDGTMGPAGCAKSRQSREDSGRVACFCHGHSSVCSAADGFFTHTVSSTFITGAEGWSAAPAGSVSPANVHFRWSPKHQDLEVISRSQQPVYLYAPAMYLGNQLMSYGQNLSFALRLDRGVPRPSTRDLILEGSGLQVSSSLGDLSSLVPCGQKFTYSFRLDERPSSGWRPELSPLQFQSLLHNLTAIKIRATYGENGRGYLDNVRLASARAGGSGAPAGWVRRCSCPPGYEGDQCERCAAGFRRSEPARGGFSPCEPCSCRGGSCDPQTGDCYSADETPSGGACAPGFYSDPWQADKCVKCPCPDGISCSIPLGYLHPRCATCPPGATGPDCASCPEGFFTSPTRLDDVRQPCQPCQCNGHIDLSVAGSCDPSSGKCLKCVNNTRGRHCEECLPGFFHGRATDACKSCDCDLLGSRSSQCDDLGRCQCRPGFEGLRCQRSDCPACFGPIKTRMEAYGARVLELEALISGGVKPVSNQKMEALLKATEELVTDLQETSERLTEKERSLQRRLVAVSREQLAEGQDLQTVADAAADIKKRQEAYEAKAQQVQSLSAEMSRRLRDAKTKLRSAEIPVADAAPGSDPLSTLVQTATSLADKHQRESALVEDAASAALGDSEKSLALVRTLMNKENKVKEVIGDLKAMYDDASSRVKSLESRGARLSGEAKSESKMADGMLKELSRLETEVPPSLKGQVDAAVARSEGLQSSVDGHVTRLLGLQSGLQQDSGLIRDLLTQGNAAQQEADQLVARVNAAKAKTDISLNLINSETGQLDDAMRALTGFDQQLDSSRAFAGAAINRLPVINATVQQAVRDNGETLSILRDVTRDYQDALGGVNLLGNLVNGLEAARSSLPPHGALLQDASRLNGDAKRLKTGTTQTAAKLTAGLDEAQRLNADAQQAADGAAAAFRNAQLTRDEVGKTLGHIGKLIGNIGQSEPVDEQRLKALEKSLSDGHDKVHQWLKPQLRSMEEQEEAHRRLLDNINLDITSILRDIKNLEDIQIAVPRGCYNSPPKEHA